jgi:hypothetical protein
MRIGKNEPSFPIDDDTGTETGSFMAALYTRIEKISEKRIEKWIYSKAGKWIALCLDLIFGTDIHDGRADFLNSAHNSVPTVWFMTTSGNRETGEKKEQT